MSSRLAQRKTILQTSDWRLSISHSPRRGCFRPPSVRSLEEVNAPVIHCQFVTGWGCLDVLTAATPSFTVGPEDSLPG